MAMATKTDYIAIFDRMKSGEVYTAKQLGVAPQSMCAMWKRGMVEKVTTTSPIKYRKVESKYAEIVRLVLDRGHEYFHLHKAGETLQMLCYLSPSNQILDCWGKLYDISGVDILQIKQEIFHL